MLDSCSNKLCDKIKAVSESHCCVWPPSPAQTCSILLARKCFRNEKIWKQTSWTLDQGWKFIDIIQKRSKSSSGCPVLSPILIMNAVSVRIFPVPLLRVLCSLLMWCSLQFAEICHAPPTSLMLLLLSQFDQKIDLRMGEIGGLSLSCSGFFLRDMINSWKWGNEVSGFAELAQRLLTRCKSPPSWILNNVQQTCNFMQS